MTFDDDSNVEISKNFANRVLFPGAVVAGDEKLFRFTGNSPNIVLVPAKPGRVGFWFYELCAKLSTGLSYMLKFSMKKSNAQSTTVASVVAGWVRVIQGFDSGATHMAGATKTEKDKVVLAFDSYYLSMASKTLLVGNNQPYSASMAVSRFGPEVELLHRLSQPPEERSRKRKIGDTAAMRNRETGELLVYHYDVHKNVGEKYNMSFGFVEEDSKQYMKKHRAEIPVYTMHKNSFGLCDFFNRKLHDKTFPHKRGGKGVKGEAGKCHDCSMAVILENVFNAYRDMNRDRIHVPTFKQLCDELSDALYFYALKLRSQ